MPALGVHALGVTALGGVEDWGATSLVITAPAVVVTSLPLTVQWTYSNTESSPQAQYRVVLRTQGGSLLYDSGLLPGAAASFALPFTLSDQSAYRVSVTVVSAQGADATKSVDFQVLVGSGVIEAELADVGRRYEVAINGVGYMLYDDPHDNQFQWGRQVVNLDAQRLVQGESNFNDAIERYSFFKWNDWSAGAGQRIGSRENSATNRFYDSEGVDPFDVPGELRLLHTTSKRITAAYAGIKAVTVGDALYSVKATDTLRYVPTPAGSETDLVLTTLTGITDIASDGQQWYVCNGSAAQRGTTSDPAANWSTLDIGVLDWAGQRICAATKVSGTGTYRQFETVADAGTSEAVRLTLPAGWNITNFTDGPGFVWFGAYVGNQGAVYAWRTGSSDAPSVAWQLPVGERPVCVYQYQGQVMVRADRAGTAVIYRCPFDTNGVLTPFLLVELETSSVGDFAGLGRFVYFSWTEMTDAGNSGVGVLDLSTGGYARGFATDVAGDVPSLAVWDGRLVLAVASVGAYEVTDSYVSSGWLKTSVLDGASALEKVFDQVSVQTLPLLAGQEVALAMSVDRADSYTAIPGAVLTGAGLGRLTTTLTSTGTNASLRIDLSGSGANSPVVTLAQVKVHSLSLSDVILQLPINCHDYPNGLGNSKLPGRAGDGVQRARTLESLAGTQVQVQDVDWPTTHVTETYEVIGARTFRIAPVRDPARPNQQSLGLVTVLTLRRPLT